MKSVLLVLCFFATINISSQDKNLIYRNSYQSESPIPVPYNVSVLYLKEGGSYSIKHQKYASKKMRRKNILLYIEKEFGKWKKVNDTIYLTDANTNRLTKFLIKGKKLSVIINDKVVVSTKWKKIE